MLRETTLFGEIDRVQTAIDRLRAFETFAVQNHPSGYMVLDSGGKDSDVIKHLAGMSGVPFEIVHCHTTADHPYTILYPTYKGQRTSMWRLIAQKGSPTRIRRWCCDILKEQTAGNGRYTVTGVRWAESVKRRQTRTIYELPSGKRERIKLNNDNDAQRRLTEQCMTKGRFVVNPIIDWQDDDVWEYHRQYTLPHNPLYEMGYKRVGCVGCPMGHHKDELEKNPHYKTLYIHAFQRFLDGHPDLAALNGWHTGQGMYDWWVSNQPLPANIFDQCTWDDYDDDNFPPN